jgi:hypothetical protein
MKAALKTHLRDRASAQAGLQQGQFPPHTNGDIAWLAVA